MKIDLVTSPLPGADLMFTVAGGTGVTAIRVFLDADLIYHHECDDPPCHEMLKIPTHGAGSLQRITATDEAGETQDLVVNLRPDPDLVMIFEEH